MNRTLRVVACIALTGCYTYRLAPLAGIHPDDQVRVTTRDGRRVKVCDVRVANDTLRGLSVKQRSIWRRGGRDSIAVAVADVTTVEVRRMDVAATAVGAPLAFAGMVLVVLRVACGPFATSKCGN